MMTIARRASLMLAAPLAFAAALGSLATGAEDTATVVSVPDTSSANVTYHGNREPLLASPLIKLPLGAIKPRGWLRKQLELEAEGFTGRLYEISEFCRHEDNAWLSPIGEGKNGWEEVPYWLRGFAALGYVLDDQRIMDEAHLWIENAIVGRLLYLSGAEWKEVPNPSGYPLEADHFLQVRFDPVKTSALRFEAKCRERTSVGTYEWHIWSAPVQGVKKHWVQQNFREKSVQACEVTWLVTGGSTGFQPPKSWRLLYRDGDDWKEVAAKGAYGLDGTKANTVAFAPVTTTALRLEVSCAEAASASTRDWKIR